MSLACLLLDAYRSKHSKLLTLPDQKLMPLRSQDDTDSDTDSETYNATLCYQQAMHIPSALLSDCADFSNELHTSQ